MCKRDKKRDKDVEAAEDDIEKEDFSSRPPSQQEVDASASLFILNLCFVLAALASFCSLLNMGGGTGISVGCSAYEQPSFNPRGRLKFHSDCHCLE